MTNTQGISFNEKEFESLLKKIRKNIRKIDFDLNKQFLLDVFSGNYTITKKKNFAILMGAIAWIILPIEKLLLLISPPYSLIAIALSTFIDEAMAIKVILNVIKDDSKEYNKFINEEGYTPSKLVNPFENLNLIESILELQNIIKPNKGTMKKVCQTNGLATYETIKNIQDYIYYEDKDYENIIYEYIRQESIKHTNEGIKIPNAKKIKAQLAFPKGFDEEKCMFILQNNMNDFLEVIELDVYKLHTFITIPHSYFLPSENTQLYISYENAQSKDLGTVRIYDLSHLSFELSLLLIIINEIKALDNESIQTILFRLGKIIVEINISLKYQVQVIYDDILMVNVAKHLEEQLTIFMKKYNKSGRLSFPVPKTNNIELPNIDIDKQIEVALKRIHLISENNTSVIFKQKSFLSFIPLYNKKRHDEYFIYIQRDNTNNAVVYDKKVKITFNEKASYSNQFKNERIKARATFVMMTETIPGCMRGNHIVEVLETLFFVQNFAHLASILDVVATIDCSQGLIVQADFTDNSVRIIDAMAKLSTQEEDYLERIISKELKNNLRLINK